MKTLLLNLGIVLFSIGSLFPAPRPNIVLIMVDDMGFSDIGCYGGEIQTPNIDALAANGLRFKQFYNSGRCCPTRASLMTGLHPHLAGIGHMTETPETPSPLKNEPYQGYLNGHCVTLAERLRDAGYHTVMTGKWHLGYHDRANWPLQRGFDKFFGIISGASDYFKPDKRRGLTLGNEKVEAPEGFYVTDDFTDRGLEYVDALTAKASKPFFWYLAYNAPHWPLEAKPEDLAKYEGQYQVGWKEISRRRLARMQELGLVEASWTPAPHEGPEWSSLTDEQRTLCDLRMAAYAACIDAIDQNVGKIVAYLKRKQLLENTVILFLTDNGACQEGGVLGAGNEKSIRDPKSTQGTGGPRCGRVWANVSSTPFRLYKHYLHEGGMATPLIVHWPEGIEASRHGHWIENFGYLPDLMPTFLDLSGGSYPKAREGLPVHPHVGQSLMPILSAGDHPIHQEPVYWEHEGNRAMRDGKWKLVWHDDGPWELFDLEADRTEMNDLKDAYPKRFAVMKRQWESWARQTGVQFQTSFSYYRMIGDYRKSQELKP